MSRFTPDRFGSDSDYDFHEGGSKDDLDLNQWVWKDAKPSPPKNDLEHGYAAEFEITTGTTYIGHKVLFFGGDRYSNNGDANIAFWFFQNPVIEVGDSANNECAGSACKFGDGFGGPALHKAGEVPHNN